MQTKPKKKEIKSGKVTPDLKSHPKILNIKNCSEHILKTRALQVERSFLPHQILWAGRDIINDYTNYDSEVGYLISKIPSLLKTAFPK